MKRTLIWSFRVTREILRDPLSLAFGVGFPVVLLLLLHTIQSNVPVPMFVLSELTPGIAVFGLSFLALFSAQLVSRDRATFVLGRMFTTPMRSRDFILGYVLPLLPMALCQGIICYAVALLLGLSFSPSILLSLLSLLPVSCVYIGIGLFCGSMLSEKAATSFCGALLTNLSAWLSGTWFALDLVGEGFVAFANLLPFARAVELGRALLSENWSEAWIPLVFVAGWATVLLTAATLAFGHKMKQ